MVEEKEKDEASCSKQVDADATEFEPGKKHPITTIRTYPHMFIGVTCSV